MSDSEECPKLRLLETRVGITPCPEVIRAVGCNVLQSTARRVSSEEATRSPPPRLKYGSSTESRSSVGSRGSVSEGVDLGLSELYILKSPAPEDQAEWLSFGACVESVRDLEFVRHFIRDVEDGGLCDQFTIKCDDELLMVNSDPIVNLSHHQVLTIFKKQTSGDEMVLILRRLIPILDDDGNEADVDFEYIRICGVVVVESEDSNIVLNLESQIVGRGPNPGLIKFEQEPDVNIRLNDVNLYLRCRDAALELTEVIDPEDKQFSFSILYYMDPNELNRGTPDDYITVLRHGPDHFIVAEGQGISMQSHTVDDSGCPTDLDNNLHLTFILHAFPHNICAFEAFHPERIGNILVASPETGVGLRYIGDDVTHEEIHEAHPDAKFFIIFDANESTEVVESTREMLGVAKPTRDTEDGLGPLQSHRGSVRPTKHLARQATRRTSISSVYSKLGYRKQ